MCPEELFELNGLVELPVVELTSADCTVEAVFYEQPVQVILVLNYLNFKVKCAINSGPK